MENSLHQPHAPLPPVLVVGGGVAGMQAALDLANLGVPVRLVEQAGHLGGQVSRLDKIYPTDHCAFCPTWTHALACREHPLITLDLCTRFAGMEKHNGGQTAVLVGQSRLIDPDACIFCCRCVEACPQKALTARAPDLAWDPSAPPVPYLKAEFCDACGRCAHVCPTQAIDLSRAEKISRIPVKDCIFACGFTEPVPAPAPEFGAHTHPDILTALAYETLSAEFNITPPSPLLCPSDGRPARSLAFIQCAGARDKRHLEYCAAVCCMHAVKQAAWLKHRQPKLDVLILYTDIRAPGKAQEAYVRAAKEAGVGFFRRRPGLVAPVSGQAGKGIVIRHEGAGKVGSTLVDLVVLNGGLARCPCPGDTRRFSSRRAGNLHRCGFCEEPADIALCVIQAGSAAVLACLGKTGTPSTLAAAAGETP
jgi:heterodisulfide reductase subunit A